MLLIRTASCCFGIRMAKFKAILLCVGILVVFAYTLVWHYKKEFHVIYVSTNWSEVLSLDFNIEKYDRDNQSMELHGTQGVLNVFISTVPPPTSSRNASIPTIPTSFQNFSSSTLPISESVSAPTSAPSFTDVSIPTTVPSSSFENASTPYVPKNKMIMFWTTFFDSVDYWFGIGREPFLKHRCSVNTCETTNDRNRLLESDALIFHFRNTLINDLPLARFPHQRWTFFLLESPDNTLSLVSPYNGLFNWTMSYRNDSDFVTPYFKIQTKSLNSTTQDGQQIVDDQNATQSANNLMEVNFLGKSRLISWLVSNCYTSGKRENYVYELRKYIPVDIYGKCGIPCLDGDPDSCNQLVFAKYKFYLSFENSNCKDYVTEKFANALRYGAVPVVYGGAQYEHIAPPHSYIDVRQFKSPQHLADYLLMLKGNDTLYNAYFKWREDYSIPGDALSNSIRDALCDMCARLHQQEPPKVYDNIFDWWIVQGNCIHEITGV